MSWEAVRRTFVTCLQTAIKEPKEEFVTVDSLSDLFHQHVPAARP